MLAVQALQIALRALRANLLRSFLTMLGIVIGVASTVIVIAIGEGAQLRLEHQIRSIGANVIMATPGAVRQGGVRLKAGTKLTLTEDDVQAVLEQIPEIRFAAASIAGAAQVIRENRNWNTTVNGTTAAHFQVRDWDLATGRFFVPAEEAAAGKVAILGSRAAHELFGPDENPIGAQIRIMNAPLEVIGVLDPKGADQDDVVFVPLSTARLRFLGAASGVNRNAIAYFIAKVASAEQIAGVKTEVESLLRQRHRILPDQEDDFAVQDPAAAMAAQQGAVRTVALLLTAIALVSLVVGGISIMNIMIVSVIERTREIGIRRAVGARMRDIRIQFLGEALVLCLLGGIIGAICGIGLSLSVARMAGWDTTINAKAIALSISFSAATGLIFGIYPAYRASKLDPIDALKAE